MPQAGWNGWRCLRTQTSTEKFERCKPGARQWGLHLFSTWTQGRNAQVFAFMSFLHALFAPYAVSNGSQDIKLWHRYDFRIANAAFTIILRRDLTSPGFIAVREPSQVSFLWNEGVKFSSLIKPGRK